MTIQRLPDGSVKIADLEDWNLDLLKSIPTLAVAGESGKAQKRLFPDAFASGDAKEEQIEDWEEFVRPELEDLFSGSLAKVTGDVSAAIPEPAPARRRAVKKKAATKKTAAKKPRRQKIKRSRKRLQKRHRQRRPRKLPKARKPPKRPRRKRVPKHGRPPGRPHRIHSPKKSRMSFTRLPRTAGVSRFRRSMWRTGIAPSIKCG